MKGMKTVQGFEVPDEAFLDDDAIFVLANLSRRGCVSFQLDGSPNEFLDQLDTINDGYFDVITQDNQCWIILSSTFEVEL